MDLKGKTIAVTGATGFLGTYLSLALLRRGATVRGVVRSPHKGPWLAQQGVDFAKADLMEPDALKAAFSGGDAIISNAALFTMEKASWDDFYQPNRVGTDNVFRAAHQAGVSRIVQISSVAVYHKRFPKNLHESTPLLTERQRGRFWAYAVTKALSEQLAWDLATEFGQELTVLRPGPIYGQGDKNIIPMIEKLFRAPFLPSPSLGFPAVHAEDVADAACEAVLNPQSAGKAYNLAGPPEPISTLLKHWKDISGQGPLLIPTPVPFVASYDISAAQTDLRFKNRPLVDGVRETLSGTIPPTN